MQLQWDESYSVGDSELDDQHKKWIEFYNRLDEVMAGEGLKDLAKVKAEILKNMSDYVDYHFRYEEEYMQSINYPETDKHWRMHKNFRNEIYRVCRDFDDGSLILNTEIMDMIRNWLVDHIIQHDMKIRNYVNSLNNKNT